MRSSPCLMIWKFPVGALVSGLVLTLFAMSCGMVSAQNLIRNGEFLEWESLSGNPPEGVPVNWSLVSSTSAPIQGPAITEEGSCSVVVVPGPGNQIVQGVRGKPLAALIEVVFVATDPGDGGRSFNMGLTQSGLETPYLNLRLVRGKMPGSLSLEAFDGRVWQQIAADIFEASDYDPEANAFSSIKPQLLRVAVDFDAARYSVSCGPDASRLKHFPGQEFFQSEGSREGLTSLAFSGANSQSPYMIGRVSVTAL